ncbi:MAG: flagellar basal body L-ring protein FlgH [Chromatiales bacterium]|nr:flagellar basal body L-ring protein FlgH [Chromatiales bacterium]
MIRYLSSIAVLLSLLASGCANSPPVRDPEFATVEPDLMVAPQPNNGAIFQAGFEMSLFEDLRARRVGDILNITLEEKTEADKAAAADLSKSNSNSIDNPILLGSALSFNRPRFDANGNTLGFTLGSDHSFSGDASATQSNELSGTIAVTVVEVLPNGNLRVRGEKRISINTGNEYVRISGIVRPSDVGPDNTVSSIKVADATIQYIGDGPLADASKIGWLARFFVSAFLPF